MPCSVLVAVRVDLVAHIMKRGPMSLDIVSLLVVGLISPLYLNSPYALIHTR